MPPFTPEIARVERGTRPASSAPHAKKVEDKRRETGVPLMSPPTLQRGQTVEFIIPAELTETISRERGLSTVEVERRMAIGLQSIPRETREKVLETPKLLERVYELGRLLEAEEEIGTRERLPFEIRQRLAKEVITDERVLRLAKEINIPRHIQAFSSALLSKKAFERIFGISGIQGILQFGWEVLDMYRGTERGQPSAIAVYYLAHCAENPYNRGTLRDLLVGFTAAGLSAKTVTGAILLAGDVVFEKGEIPVRAERQASLYGDFAAETIKELYDGAKNPVERRTIVEGAVSVLEKNRWKTTRSDGEPVASSGAAVKALERIPEAAEAVLEKIPPTATIFGFGVYQRVLRILLSILGHYSVPNLSDAVQLFLNKPEQDIKLIPAEVASIFIASLERAGDGRVASAGRIYERAGAIGLRIALNLLKISALIERGDVEAAKPLLAEILQSRAYQTHEKTMVESYVIAALAATLDIKIQGHKPVDDLKLALKADQNGQRLACALEAVPQIMESQNALLQRAYKELYPDGDFSAHLLIVNIRRELGFRAADILQRRFGRLKHAFIKAIRLNGEGQVLKALKILKEALEAEKLDHSLPALRIIIEQKEAEIKGLLAGYAEAA